MKSLSIIDFIGILLALLYYIIPKKEIVEFLFSFNKEKTFRTYSEVWAEFPSKPVHF